MLFFFLHYSSTSKGFRRPVVFHGYFQSNKNGNKNCRKSKMSKRFWNKDALYRDTQCSWIVNSPSYFLSYVGLVLFSKRLPWGRAWPGLKKFGKLHIFVELMTLYVFFPVKFIIMNVFKLLDYININFDVCLYWSYTVFLLQKRDERNRAKGSLFSDPVHGLTQYFIFFHRREQQNRWNG